MENNKKVKAESNPSINVNNGEVRIIEPPAAQSVKSVKAPKVKLSREAAMDKLDSAVKAKIEQADWFDQPLDGLNSKLKREAFEFQNAHKIGNSVFCLFFSKQASEYKVGNARQELQMSRSPKPAPRGKKKADIKSELQDCIAKRDQLNLKISELSAKHRDELESRASALRDELAQLDSLISDNN